MSGARGVQAYSDLFSPCQVEYGGKQVRGLKITCAKCSHAERGRSNGDAGSDQRQFESFAVKMRKNGWTVGHLYSRHKCPACTVEAARALAKSKVETRLMPSRLPENLNFPNKEDTMTPETAPRQMGRDDRRIIFEKLNEVYIDDKRGYSEMWSDPLVAKDLGVPRAWVSAVRDEMFGPDTSNETLKKDITAGRQMVIEAGVALAKFEAGMKAIVARLDHAEKHLF